MAECHQVRAAEVPVLNTRVGKTEAAKDGDGKTEDVESDAFVIAEYNCAIAHIAESYPTVCGHELAMFAIALPDCSVERTHWLVNGEHQCGYLVKLKKS